MRNKLGMTRIAAMMSQTTGRPRKLCEDFMRELFVLTADSLAAGETVKIKGFGTFKLTLVESRKSVDVSTGEEIIIPSYRKITFVASRELAGAVNSPFEMFQAVELTEAEDDSDESKDGVAEAEESEAEAKLEIDAKIEIEAPIPSCDGLDESEPVSENAGMGIADTDDEYVEEEIPASPAVGRQRGFKFGWGFFAGFVSAIVAGAAAFMIYQKVSGDISSGSVPDMAEAERKMAEADSIVSLIRKTASEVSQSTADSIAMADVQSSDKGEYERMTEEKTAPTSPSDSPVYDVVTTTRYLTTIASEHYGNFNLWPYIYEENKAILGHPDRIKPGTKVVVPPLSKYGVDARDKADIEKAKKMGVKIYSRYHK